MTPNDPSLIIGTTVINHQIRVKLGLAVHEYCMMDFLSTWYGKNIAPPSPQDWYPALGVEHDQAIKVAHDLREKGFIAPLSFVLTDKWTNAFAVNDGDFDKLWKLNPYGSRVESKLRYKTVIKKISPEALYKKLEEYVKACEATGFQKPKMLNTWLNPKQEHWNDPLPPPKVMPVNINSINIEKKDDDFFKDMPPKV